nr:hypothetical protein [Microbacterium bovistercoris]
MLGATWTATLDAALDEISRRGREQDNALEAITAFLRQHPEFEQDEHLSIARMALL